ncbi:hypothetical protein [Ruegeria sp. R13_0]|uniref:hypothetical protein n=1 Tax=Ruegeria sp. R13_0 TaxID=2821099 RepID=UPI001FFE1638|nr:hypothetical protein [Ruegeria sp. R13_0]
MTSGIEDVLSSVKRLVSEDGRKVSDADTATAPRTPGRLVLTDALRVGDAPKSEPLKLDPKYSAEDSAKPMLLRACDIVQPGEAANHDGAEEVGNETPSENLSGSLSAKIEALEAAIARTEDQWEPDGDSDDAYSGTPSKALHWIPAPTFEEGDAEDVDAPSGEADAKADEPASFVRHGDTPKADPVEDTSEDMIDDEIGLSASEEEALREMIAEVVRSELQGALGERITRNVRKMVRREIHRALTAKELE